MITRATADRGPKLSERAITGYLRARRPRRIITASAKKQRVGFGHIGDLVGYA